MFKAERIQKIKEIIYDRKQIDVITLSQLLNVTDVTIRSDLEQLERSGYITRMHGGAILNESTANENELNDILAGKDIEYDKNREDIGKIGAKLIQEKEWIFLGPGATCYYIAKDLLQRKNINILTNNMYVVNLMFANPAINVIASGGKLNYHRFSTYSGSVEKSTEGVYFSKAFFTAGGVDLKAGYTSTDSDEAALIQMIANKTKDLIFAVDYTKYDNIAFMQIGSLDMANIVISNDKMPDEYKGYYTKNNIKVYTSYDLKPLAL